MAQDGDLRWWPRVKESWGYATWIASVLFFIGALAGIILAWRMGVSSLFGFVFAVSDPAAAALILLLLSIITPDLYAPRKLILFHVFAFPVLFAVGVLLFRFFIASSDLGQVMVLSNLPRVDRMWSNASLLGLLWGIQVLALLALRRVNKDDEPDKLS